MLSFRITEGAAYSYDKNNFDMELSSDQQQKYQAQFDEEGEPFVMVTEIPGNI